MQVFFEKFFSRLELGWRIVVMEDRRRARPPARFSTGALQVTGFYSAEARKRGEHDRLSRAGGRRGLVTDEVAAREQGRNQGKG